MKKYEVFRDAVDALVEEHAVFEIGTVYGVPSSTERHAPIECKDESAKELLDSFDANVWPVDRRTVRVDAVTSGNEAHLGYIITTWTEQGELTGVWTDE